MIHNQVERTNEPQNNGDRHHSPPPLHQKGRQIDPSPRRKRGMRTHENPAPHQITTHNRTGQPDLSPPQGARTNFRREDPRVQPGRAGRSPDTDLGKKTTETKRSGRSPRADRARARRDLGGRGGVASVTSRLDRGETDYGGGGGEVANGCDAEGGEEGRGGP